MTLTAAGLMLTALLLAGSCDEGGKDSGSGSGQQQSKTGSGKTPSGKGGDNTRLAEMDLSERLALGRQFSLFAETPLMDDVPDALDMSRTGDEIFAHGLQRTEGNYYLVMLPLLEDRLGPGRILHESNNLLRTYVAAHPRGVEALGSTYFQKSRQVPVVDLIHRFGPELPPETQGVVMVPYNSSQDFPAEVLGESAMDIEPYYNWRGDKVIVPLKDLGLCVVPVNGMGMRFVGYPQFEGGFTGMASGPLPDERSDQYLWLSMWRMEGPLDTCRLYRLDLQTFQWELMATLDWVVYKVGASRPVDSPWLISGSRPPDATDSEGETYAPQAGQTGVRVPKLARLHTDSGAVELVGFQGNPVWQVGMEPTGRYVAFMDMRRHAMVRTEPATGKVDIDPRWWTDSLDIKIMVSEGGEDVLFWQNNILIKGQWTQHEDGTGYEDLPTEPAGSGDDVRPSAADLPDDETLDEGVEGGH